MKKILVFLAFMSLLFADISHLEKAVAGLEKNTNIPNMAKKSFNASNKAWQKWYKLEKAFIIKVLPEIKEQYLSGILESRISFLTVQPMNLESDIDNSTKIELYTNPRNRDKSGVSGDFDKKFEEAQLGSPADVNEVETAERELQDKWLNEDYKAMRALLNNEQKLLLRDAQRAWLKYHGTDPEFMYDVMERDGLAQRRANFTLFMQFIKRSVQLEYLLSNLKSKEQK